ncbi:hypothetical protein FRB90_003188 [Tulasnella sp. 427]|nr:hypothetical protein FRB90_003188 [Tulasnella sp. 427]
MYLFTTNPPSTNNILQPTKTSSALGCVLKQLESHFLSNKSDLADFSLNATSLLHSPPATPLKLSPTRFDHRPSPQTGCQSILTRSYFTTPVSYAISPTHRWSTTLSTDRYISQDSLISRSKPPTPSTHRPTIKDIANRVSSDLYVWLDEHPATVASERSPPSAPFGLSATQIYTF